jgi:hypothetical protein
MRRGYSELGAAAIAIAIMTAVLYFVTTALLSAFEKQTVACEVKSDALKVTQ